MRGLKNEINKPTYDMKKLILLLFIPLVFGCSDFWWAHDDDVSQYLVLNVENYNSGFSFFE